MSAFVWQQGRMSVAPTSVPVLSLLRLDGVYLNSNTSTGTIGGSGVCKKKMKKLKRVTTSAFGRKHVCGRVGVMKRPTDYGGGFTESQAEYSQGDGGVDLTVPWYGGATGSSHPSVGGSVSDASTAESSESTSYASNNTTTTLVGLMGLWDVLAAKIQHIPGDPSVVVDAIKVCVAYSRGRYGNGDDVGSALLTEGIRLAVRLAEMIEQDSGISPNDNNSGGSAFSSFSSGSNSATPNKNAYIVSCDVLAAAIVATVMMNDQHCTGSLNRFPTRLIRDRVSFSVALLSEDIVKVSKVASRIDVYDDDGAMAVRDMSLAFYDVHATLVEVVRRVAQLEDIVERVRHKSYGDDGDYNSSTSNSNSRSTRIGVYQCLALEALQVYAPLAHALGMNDQAKSLENASLEILFPSSYKKTCDWLNKYVSHHDAILESARQELESAVLSHPHFSERASNIIVQSRTKSAMSTLKKLLRLGNVSMGGRKREEVFDVLGLRAIVVPLEHVDHAEEKAIEACYIVEKVVRSMWPVIESRSKDYIASPKPNGYSSIHRSVIVDQNDLSNEMATTVELQIRTMSMHIMAEQGDASHGAYKGGLSVSQTQKLQEIQEKNMNRLTVQEEYDAGEALFRSIDINGDGEVSLNELQLVMDDLGEEGAEALLQRFDTNNDGVISLDEFMEFQKVVGISNVIRHLDETYADALPLDVDDVEVPPLRGGIHNKSSASKDGGGTQAMHVWGKSYKKHYISREHGGGRCLLNRAMAFREGEESVSSGSLDETRGDDACLEEMLSASSGYDRRNVVTVVDESSDEGASAKIEPSKDNEDGVKSVSARETSPFDSAMFGFRRLFSKAGTEEIEATWSLEAVSETIQVANAASKVLPVKKKIKLPRHGPVILGAVADKDNDYIIDIPTISGRHARLEVIRDRQNGMSKCVIMDLGSTNGVWVNRSKINPFKEVHLFPGDIVCFAEPRISFKIDAAVESNSENDLGPAVNDALVLAESLESEAATMGVFAPTRMPAEHATSLYTKLVQKEDFQGAYMLLLGEAMRSPTNGSIWAKLAGIERQRSRRKIQSSNAATTRAFLRAALERFDVIEDEDVRRESLSRVFTTWALLEFDMRNDGPARILFQKGVRCLKKLSDSNKSNKLLAKLLCSWATREWKLKDLTVAARLCSEALDADPKNPFVLTLLAKIRVESQRYSEARSLFQRAFVADRTYMPALQAWAKMEASINHMEKARQLFRAACAIDSKNQYILQAWAFAEGQAGNLRESRDLYKQCTAAHPECRAAWHGWAKLEEDNGFLNEAKSLYLKVLELKPKSKRTLSCLGRLERLMGNLDISEKLLRRAISADSQHVSSLQELALTLKQKKQYSEAHALEKKVSRINAAYRSQVMRVKSTVASNKQTT